jgi:signal transduction histidine kinase
MARSENESIATLKKSLQNDDVAERLKSLTSLAAYYNEARSQTALTFAKRALEEAITFDQKIFIAKAHVQLAVFFLRQHADYTASLNHCEKALNFSKTFNSKKELAEVFKMMGVNHHYLGDIQKSQDNYRNALDIVLSAKKHTRDELKLVADLYYNIAILNRGEETLKYRKQNLELAQKYYELAGNKNGIARCHDGMAVYFFYRKNKEKSLACMQTALSMFEELNDKDGIYLTCNNIGTLKIQSGKFNEGLTYLFRSLDLRKKMRNPVSVATSHINIGRAYLEKKKYENALVQFIDAEKILAKAKSKFELSVLLQMQAECYANLGQPGKAFACLKSYTELREELHQYEIQKAYKDTSTRYDIELSEKNATIDRLRNHEIAEYVHKLESSNEELKQFAHAASHDLKEPLRTISSFVSLLEKHCEKKIDATGREYLNYITSATLRLDKLVKDILDLSRINRTNNEFTEVNLNDTYKDVLVTLAAIIGERNIQLTCTHLPDIIADKSLMFQLFLNLIANGIKYNESDKPEIKVSSKKRGNYVTISFADNGIGIPTEYRDKIFEIFQRLNPDKEDGGTGIGLTLCKRIVKKHNGKIWLEPNKPTGTIFYVQLPA